LLLVLAVLVGMTTGDALHVGAAEAAAVAAAAASASSPSSNGIGK
jgi:hypothetical protein